METRYIGLLIGLAVGILAFFLFGPIFGGSGGGVLGALGIILISPVWIWGSLLALIVGPLGNFPGGLLIAILLGALSYPLIGYGIGRLIERYRR